MRRLVPFAALVALAGCQKLGPTPQEAADVARDYLEAAAAEDWKGVCATRTRLERHRLEQQRGSCERAFREILTPSLPDLQGAEPGAVRVKGELAGIDVIGADGDKLTTLTATIDQGRWRLETVAPGQTP